MTMETGDAHAGEISFDRQGPIAILTINRPAKRNAMTVAMMEQLWAHSRELQRDDSVRVVVITGAGDGAFSAGGDLTELLPRLVDDADDGVINPDPAERFFSALYKPIVAAINGLCIAGGFELMLGTDIRVVADDATLGLAEVKWGIVPGAGSMVRLPKQIGWAPAMELLLTGDLITAQRALELGLVNRVVPRESVMEVALEFGLRLAANGPVAVQAAKRTALETANLAAAYRLESDLTRTVLRSRDIRIGLQAFADKTTPTFEGR